MITIINKWAAEYLVFDEPIHPNPVPLTSPHGITLQPGQQITQIGKERRTAFMLIPGHFMIYEGLLKVNGIVYAIFHNPRHDEPQMQLFGSEKQYRYALACVFVTKAFQCFLIGDGRRLAMRDVQLDYLA
jgi:hypothetical protein